MQINLFNKKNIEYFKWLGWVLAIIFFFLLIKSCEKVTDELAKIKTPAVAGKFTPVKPIQTPVSIGQDLSKIDKSKKYTKEELEFYQNQLIEFADENYNLQMKFANETDSLKRIIMFNDATKLQNFNHRFEDDNIYIDVNGIVQGDVKSVSSKYYIKSKEISVKVPTTRFRLLAGGGAGIDTELSQGLVKVNLGFQNQKGNIYRAGYLKLGNQNFVLAEFDVSIFESKR